MSRSSLFISMLAVFLIGAALGLMGGILFARQVRAAMRSGPVFISRLVPPREPPTPAEALARMQRMLDLTPEQVREIEPHVRESQQVVEAARETLNNRIDAVLDPRQRERWQMFQRTRTFPAPRAADERAPVPPPVPAGSAGR